MVSKAIIDSITSMILLLIDIDKFLFKCPFFRYSSFLTLFTHRLDFQNISYYVFKRSFCHWQSYHFRNWLY